MIASLTALVLVAAVVFVGYREITKSPCGSGMTATGSPWVCVGLDVNNTRMRAHDPLASLEARIAKLDRKIHGQFDTIVLLDDMTPDPRVDSLQFQSVRHSVEGAIAAIQRANNTTLAGSLEPPIRLLLANFGSEASSWPAAVSAIGKAQQSSHIVAVTGIGQSLDATRAAVSVLSNDGITTVGSVVTADDMNLNLANHRIPDFFRVAPTNKNEVDVAVNYIRRYLPHQRTMLVSDTNPDDSYAQTLAGEFGSVFGSEIKFTENYRSPTGSLTGISRDNFMKSEFGPMHADICSEHPDLIYFAGRGADLRSFLEALAGGGACPLPSLTVMTGDDASTIVGEQPLPGGRSGPQVLYTGLAAPNEWAASQAPGTADPTASDEATDYHIFYTAFTRANGFSAGDLGDGVAAMNYDAVLTAATAARADPAAASNPKTVAGFMLGLRCRRSVPGASGMIAIGTDGNPRDKVMPILRINPSGSESQVAPPTGPAGPIDYATQTC